MNPLKMQEIIRVIHCMSGEDFKIVFGADYEHYLAKRNMLGIGEFICYLDEPNIIAMMEHVKTKQEAYRQRKLA